MDKTCRKNWRRVFYAEI